MQEHYIVTADAARLRIYMERRPVAQLPSRLDVVEAMDFPAGFSAAAGGVGREWSERKERARRCAEIVAAEVNAFLGDRPEASWDFAGVPGFHEAAMGAFAPEARCRLRHAAAADLVDRGPEEVWGFFARVA